MSQRQCPDCGRSMEPIRLIETTGTGGIFSFSKHETLGYVRKRAKKSFGGLTYKEVFDVQAARCPNCGRIILFG